MSSLRDSGLILLVSAGSAAILACRTVPPAPASGADSAVAAAEAVPTDLPVAERRRLAAEMGRRFEAHYVFPEVGARMAAALREHADRGDYDGLAGAAELARVVTEQMREVSHDRHVMLEHKPPGAAKTAEDERCERLEALHAQTRGFGATERLPGNVARLVIDSFEPVGAAREAVTRHLSEAADADALIVDLRDNHGGDPSTVAL